MILIIAAKHKFEEHLMVATSVKCFLLSMSKHSVVALFCSINVGESFQKSETKFRGSGKIMKGIKFF